MNKELIAKIMYNYRLEIDTMTIDELRGLISGLHFCKMAMSAEYLDTNLIWKMIDMATHKVADRIDECLEECVE